MENIINTEPLYRHSIVSDITLANGKTTKIVTFFNNQEVNFEELNAGVRLALLRCDTVKKFTNTILSISTNGVKEIAKFPVNEK